MPTLKTRHIGFCPICEGDFKLVDGTKMVHHGYKRPGVGYIIGDCLSVYKAPYELSTETCEEYKALLLDKLAKENTYLARLERGEITMFLVERRKANGHYREMETVEIATPSGYVFSQELESQTRDTKRTIKSVKNEIARIDGWIAKWELKEVRTVEEELEKLAQTKAERKALNDARKAKKQAKADALKAKYEAWEQEKAQLKAKYKAIFVALVAQVEMAGLNEGSLKYHALEMACEMKRASNKKGYLSFYARELEIDDVMVKLGLAEVKTFPDGQTWVSHKF